MLFFPLALVVAVALALRGRLAWAVTSGVTLFVLAVALAWQVQGFTPTPRDLAWLAIVLAATGGAWWFGRRRREAAATVPIAAEATDG